MLILMYILGIFATFYILYVVVEKFLIPTIYLIKDKIGLTDDQTGALTSFVSSAPELSVSLISLTIAIRNGNQLEFEKIASLGPSAVIGSALFSILFIVGASAWFGGKQLTWHSITRDMGYYIFAVASLYFCMLDSKIQWYEGVMLLGLYFIYALLVANWPRITRTLGIEGTTLIEQDIEESKQEIETLGDQPWNLTNFFPKVFSFAFFKLNEGFVGYKVVYNILAAIGLVVISSWAMVELALKLALAASIPEALIGVTILAAGTSVPDLLASIKTAREGYADTAVTNAVGSNVFDVLGNLGLTWTIAALFTAGRDIPVDITSLSSSIVLLIASSVALILIFIAKRFNISKTISVLLMTSYILYVIYISLKITGTYNLDTLFKFYS
jgi:K+-dependent Na+/Ca+ exchanger-like protein